MYIDVDAAIKEAKQVLADKEKVYNRLTIVRSDLRNAVKVGGITPEQRKWINEQFPVVTRQRNAKDK